MLAILVGVFSAEAVSWGGTAWMATWMDACSHEERHRHGAGEFVGDGLDQLPAAVALGALGALLAAAGVLVAFRVAAGRSPGQVVAGRGGAPPTARFRVLAPAVLAAGVVAGAGTVLLLASVSRSGLSHLVDGWLRSRASPACIPRRLSASIGLHAAAFAAALVAGWATRVQRRGWIVAVALAGAAAGACAAGWPRREAGALPGPATPPRSSSPRRSRAPRRGSSRARPRA
jgi:hypothetical protein